MQQYKITIMNFFFIYFFDTLQIKKKKKKLYSIFVTVQTIERLQNNKKSRNLQQKAFCTKFLVEERLIGPPLSSRHGGFYERSYILCLPFSLSQIHITKEVYEDKNIVNTSLFNEVHWYAHSNSQPYIFCFDINSNFIF